MRQSLSLRIKKDLIPWLKKEAEKNNMSVSRFIENLLLCKMKNTMKEEV